jgi:hypothetical protein
LLEEPEATILDAVVETHQAQFVGESLARVEAAKASEVIAAQPGVGIDRLGNVPHEAQAFAGPDNKVSTGLMEGVKAAEVQVTTIHDVKGARLDHQHLQGVAVMAAAFGDVEKGGDRPPQVQQRVQLDGGLGGGL